MQSFGLLLNHNMARVSCNLNPCHDWYHSRARFVILSGMCQHNSDNIYICYDEWHMHSGTQTSGHTVGMRRTLHWLKKWCNPPMKNDVHIPTVMMKWRKVLGAFTKACVAKSARSDISVRLRSRSLLIIIANLPDNVVLIRRQLIQDLTAVENACTISPTFSSPRGIKAMLTE